VLPLPLNPFLWSAPSPDLNTLLRPFAADAAARQTDLFVVAAFHPTWLAWFLAAALKPVGAIGCFPAKKPRGLLSCLLQDFGLDEVVLEGPAWRKDMHERDRYRELARWIGADFAGGEIWKLDSASSSAAERKLRDLGLKRGNYLVCFPTGVSSVPEKRWPLERFRAVLDEIQREYQLPVLLTGDIEEESQLRTLASQSLSAQPPFRLFLGGPDDLRTLAGLIRNARAWLGNDTGPAHLAQAYGVPGVAVYGGGAGWPAYGPWQQGTIGLVHPLPCFQCFWDCLFGHGLCVESIPARDVLAALRQVLERPPSAPEVRSLATLSADLLVNIEDANRRYREAQNHNQERLGIMVELERAAVERLEKLKDSNHEAQLRDELLNRQRHELERIARERHTTTHGLEERDRALQDLQSRVRALREDLDRSQQQIKQSAETISRMRLDNSKLIGENESLMQQVAALQEEGLFRYLRRRFGKEGNA
jgi:hypothetical protein